MANKPRWEAKYEKMLKQEPVSEKITKLKEEIERTKMNEVGTFKTKEEYQDALREAKLKLPKQEAQLQDYENYEKNKEKIKNIYEYRKILENKLAKLPKSQKREIEDKNKELNENNAKTQEISNKVDELLAKINSGKLTSVERAATEVELQNTLQTEKLLKEKSSNLDNEIKKLNIEEEKANLDEIVAEREKYERKIAKCNLIAANLLKGKDLEDIQIKIEPSNKVFKQQKTTQEYEKQEDASQEQLEEPKKQEKAPKEGELGEPEIIDDEQENYPANLEDFAIRHPKLAKIAEFFKDGFNNIKDKVAKVFAKKDKNEVVQDSNEKADNELEQEVDEQQEQTVDKETEQEVNEQQEQKTDEKYMEEVKQAIKEIRENKNEDELLKHIANDGHEKTFKEHLRVNKLIAANNYAEKYGRQYEKQDGATHKKDESEQNR